MRFLSFLLVLALCVWGPIVIAQQRTCGTSEYNITQGNKPLTLPYRKAAVSKTNSFFDTAVITIPVVAHVIHNGEPIGTGTNISDAVIQSQIRVLNEDFRRIPGTLGFSNLAASADTRFKFALACKDPNGNPTNGIVRVRGAFSSYNIGLDQQMKGLSHWPSSNYLNLYSANTNVLGWASWPITNLPGLAGVPVVDSSIEGVVGNWKNWGVVPRSQGGAYNKGRTITHELGHYFGLIHTSGDADCSLNDYVIDTPAQDQQTNNCPRGRDSCPDSAGRDMIENYLDYTDDSCMNTFTNGQMWRMRYVLINSPRRSSLYFSSLNQCAVVDTAPILVKLKTDLKVLYVDGSIWIQLPNVQSFRLELFDATGRRITSDLGCSPVSTNGTYSLEQGIIPRGLTILRAVSDQGSFTSLVRKL